MKEKKTKKMTKAEAFEYLKGKRVLCGAYSREIQDFAKSVGFNWSSCKDEYWLVLALFFGKDGRLTYTLSPKQFENHDDYEEISADDILSIEIVEEEKTMEAKALDEIAELGKRISGLLSVLGGGHVRITVDDVTLYGEGMNLFHSDPF